MGIKAKSYIGKNLKKLNFKKNPVEYMEILICLAHDIEELQKKYDYLRNKANKLRN